MKESPNTQGLYQECSSAHYAHLDFYFSRSYPPYLCQRQPRGFTFFLQLCSMEGKAANAERALTRAYQDELKNNTKAQLQIVTQQLAQQFEAERLAIEPQIRELNLRHNDNLAQVRAEHTRLLQQMNLAQTENEITMLREQIERERRLLQEEQAMDAERNQMLNQLFAASLDSNNLPPPPSSPPHKNSSNKSTPPQP